MARPIDEPIGPEEWLFLGVQPVHIQGVDVLQGAIRLPAQSVNRSKYDPDPSAVIAEARGETAAAGVQVQNLPAPYKPETGAVHEFHAADVPLDGNAAHAEVQVRREGIGWNPKYKPNSPALRAKLRELIAAQFKVIRRL